MIPSYSFFLFLTISTGISLVPSSSSSSFSSSSVLVSPTGRNYYAYPNSDILADNETLFPQLPGNYTNNLPALMTICDATPSCIGFNINGWLKNGTSSLGPNPVDVYLLDSTPPSPPDPATVPLFNVWPYPRNITIPINNTNPSPLVVAQPLQFTAVNPSPDLDAAFARYTLLMFPHGIDSSTSTRTKVQTIVDQRSRTVRNDDPYSRTYSSRASTASHRTSSVGDTVRITLPLDEVIVTTVQVDVTDVNVPLQNNVDESYTIIFPPSVATPVATITVSSSTVYGAYHALETLSQLIMFDFTNQVYFIPPPLSSGAMIQDSPRFTWRGIMIDPARRYIPVKYIYATIDSLVYAKMNVLHVHIVDCDSWPLEVPGEFSLLWEGSFSPRERYTVQDLRNIVEYGRQRGVRIIFENDSPGHSGSMCDGYPELCPSLTCREPLNPASNATLPALTSVIGTLANVSIDDVIHLGGDEVNPTCWNESSVIRQWMIDHGMGDNLDAVYEYFVNATNTLATDTLEKSPMRWEEVWKHFGTLLDPRTIIHAWLSTDALNAAANNGYRTVFSVNSAAYYLDYLDILWSDTYKTDILADTTNTSAIPYILGGEVCMWGETVDAGTFLQTIWPRAAAAAERLWSYNFAEYPTAAHYSPINRIAQFRCLLLERGIPAASPGNTEAGSMGPAWTVGSCGGGYKALC